MRASAPEAEVLVEQASEILARVRKAVSARLVGKTELVDGILAAAVAEGHLLIEGVPGLAKTLAVRAFADAAGLLFRRVQFTPDLLPGDITGTLYYDAPTGRFVPRKGPVFANVVLADEINRAPAKVQSALLEAMEERQVTIGDSSLELPFPFIVLATQNPIEHEGTFRLPEAQLDRFMLKVKADYPSAAEEAEIVRLAASSRDGGARRAPAAETVLTESDLGALRAALAAVRVDDAVLGYCVRLVRATRPDPAAPDPALRELSRLVEYGASPRASIVLHRAARVAALFAGRAWAGPDDVKAFALSALRHRVAPSYEAEAEGVDSDELVRRILSIVPVP